MTREEKLTLGGAAAFFAALLAWGWSAGAFAGNKGTPGVPDVPRPTPDPPITPPPAPTQPTETPTALPPGTVPKWLLEGGPPPDDHEDLAWYTYRGHWIRVHGEHDVDSAPAETGHQHPHGVIWWTAYGAEGVTPLATARATGVPGAFDEFGSFEDENIDHAAAKAAAWIDANAG